MPRSRVKIRTQLALSFAIGGWLPIGIEALAIARLSNLNDHTEQLADYRVPALTTAYAWRSYLQDAAVKMGNILISDDQNELTAQLNAIKDDRQKAQEATQRLSASLTSPEARTKLQDVLAARADYAANEEQFLVLAEAGNNAAAKKVLEAARPMQIATVDALARLIDFENVAVAAARDASAQQYHSSRDTVIVCGLLTLLIGSLVGAYVINSVRSRLGGELDYAAEIARRISSGDFDMEIRTSHGDGSSLLATIGSMRDSLLKIVSHVSRAADAVRRGTGQLSQGNEELIRRTQEQASALAETSANMEELTVSVKHNADNARQTTQHAMEVCGQAESGGAVVQRAVAAMAEISASSRRIADIISVINEIAFQTNLLALNAAVEAARAGEQGRGFAVVASEVRSLAQRSAMAAKEIKALIAESVAKVGVGSELIDESGKTLAGIIAGVKKVTEVIGEIAAASEEQAAGIDEVNTAVARMDSTTQQNSALVDHAAATSKDIQQQAEDLAAKVAFFRTGSTDVAVKIGNKSESSSPAAGAPGSDVEQRRKTG
jgi:methyl-accepting chemotaxis protein